ncbi:MAG: peptidoglycan DD-metalloendopeptidase family protein [Anaerolineales bacterium]
MSPRRARRSLTAIPCIAFTLAACASPAADLVAQGSAPQETPTVEATVPGITSTPLPARPAYDPGQLVDYTAQNGDNLIALAARFNTTIEEIMRANPEIPSGVATLPAGFPMKIPIYYRAFWGTSFRIIPDSHFVNGPGVVEFDTPAFVDTHPGWLAEYREYASGRIRSGAGLVDLVATNFSVSPRLLLALLEYQSGALSQPELLPAWETYPLRLARRGHAGVYLQLVAAANELNNGYYAWRNGKLIEFELPDGSLYRPDPWVNASTVALQLFFNETRPAEFETSIGPEGLAAVYVDLFGDPWQNDIAHIPGSLSQPEFRLPFVPGDLWAYTGGPHTGWGDGEPFAALDFAPGLLTKGCISTDTWATAMADGVVVRSETGVVVLDLDGDGDERTGWVIFYLHLSKHNRARVGQYILAGQPVGHPSCEGGESTGTHVHIARKYNGEWINAAGALPFVMEGWAPAEGLAVYLGTLTKLGHLVTACTCSDAGTGMISQAAYVPIPTPDLQATPLTSEN